MDKKPVKVTREKTILLLVGFFTVGLALVANFRPPAKEVGEAVVIKGKVAKAEAGKPQSEEHHLILTGGLTQSGSTLQYNIVRLLMESVDPEDFIAGYVWNVNPAPIHKYAVLKCHDCAHFLNNPKWTTKTVFTIHRDIRDIAASRKKKGYPHDEKELRKLIGMYETVANQAHADWQYEDVIKNGAEFVSEAAAMLNRAVPGINITVVDAEGILATIKEAATNFEAHHEKTADGKMKQDEFQFYKQHIRDGKWGSFKTVFNQSVCLDLSDTFDDYLKKHEYPLREACST